MVTQTIDDPSGPSDGTWKADHLDPWIAAVYDAISGGVGAPAATFGIDLGAAPYNAAFDGTDATNNTAKLLDAIDDAQAMIMGTGTQAGVPPILLRTGRFAINSQVVLKTASLLGSRQGIYHGTVIAWDGSNGATAFVKDYDTPGAGSNWYCNNLTFVKGTGTPATWLDFASDDPTSGNVDKFCRLSDLHFVGSSSDCIVARNWINWHLEQMRWDYIEGYAIKLITHSGLSLSSFILDKFTYDHQSDIPNPGKGLLGIDNTEDAGNVGVVALSNGRIEINSEMAAEGAAVGLIVPDSSPNPSWVGLVLQNVTMASTSGGYLVYRDTADTGSGESVTLINVRTGGLDGILGGSWPSQLPAIPTTTIIDFLQTSDFAEAYSASQLHLRPWGWGGNNFALRVRGSGSGTDNFRLDGGGNIFLSTTGNATTLGSVAKRWPVYDIAGTLLGYVPIYGSIT